MDIEVSFTGDNGALTWSSADDVGSIFWDSTNGWTISGYDNLVISNDASGDTPTNAITDVETWYIVPCSTGVPEEWPYFRIGVPGYSVCEVGDQAGFEDPSSVTSTTGNVPSEYFAQIGTVIEINVVDLRLGCDATTVLYDDGEAFNYCYDEIRCSDWVDRCENDCTACVGYDTSGSSDNLVSEVYYVDLPEDADTCSFGTTTQTCGTEVGPNEASVFYQCVGAPRTLNLRRKLAPRPPRVQRRALTESGPCHGVWGRWSDCSRSCGHGFETRTYTHFSGNCHYENGARDVRQCQIRTCPRIQNIVTHDAHFVPDINAQQSTMHLHFTTSLNAPWQFERHSLTITDRDGAVDSGSITVFKVNEDCNGLDVCVQEWTMDYTTNGVCDPDGVHKLSMTPFMNEEAFNDPIQVVIALLSHGCGSVAESDKLGGYSARPVDPFANVEPSHTMTVTMDVRQPENVPNTDTQITELLSIVSTNIGNIEVQEISRNYQTRIALSFDHSGSDSEVLFDFFDYLPHSVSRVLGVPSSSVRDFQVGSVDASTHMTTSLTISVSDGTKASVIHVLLRDNPNTFTKMLTTDLRSQASWLEEDVVLDQLEDMKVSVTCQAQASTDIDLDRLQRKLEALGYEVVTHDEFGQTTNVIPLTQSQTLEIQTESSNASESTTWKILFGFVCVLLAVITFTMCYKRTQDKKQQKAMKATKLYEYEIRKNAKSGTTQTEKPHWDFEGDPTHIPYHNTATN